MKNNDILFEINALLKKIINILESENENNWIRAFKKMQLKVDMALEGSLSKEDVLEYVRNSYKSIFQGNGSFSDFSIWRDDLKERIYINNNFKLLTDRLFNLIK